MRVPTGRLWVVEDPEPQQPRGIDPGQLSPGRYIRDQRLRRAMTLDEVSAKTKIPRSSLEALEEERWSALPGPVFVKGFLRCCARALEIDDQVVLDLLYEQERAKMHAEREPEPPMPTIRGRDLPGSRMGSQHSSLGGERSPASVDRDPRAPSVILRDLLGRMGALSTRFPAANVLLWIAVVLLVLGLAFAVMMAFGAQQAVPPQS
ncbi:MAG TPA: hypothetical protein ENJ18_01535 [Nannocystis exedens]|nr:hypothetical protein [Nannocystis exedens]